MLVMVPAESGRSWKTGGRSWSLRTRGRVGSNLRTSGRRFLGGTGAERKLGVGKNQVNWSVAKIVGQNINRRRRHPALVWLVCFCCQLFGPRLSSYLMSNSESKSLKAEQGGNLQFAEYHGNLQKNALTTYKKKKSGIEKVRNKFQNSPRGF